MEPEQTVAELIALIHSNAGASGTYEILEALAALDVYSLQPLIDQPMPMFFSDAWEDVIAVLIKECNAIP